MAERQHHESIVIPAGRGTIYDAAGVQLAIGETTTTVYADPRQLTQPAGDCRRGAEVPRRRRELALPATARPEDELPLRQAVRRPSGAPRSSRRVCRSQLLPRGEARLPAALGRLAGDRVRRHRQQGPRRPRGGVQPQPDRQDRQADDRPRPVRARDRRPQHGRRSSRATISSRRSITRSRRTPRQVLRQTISRWHAKSATAVVLDRRTGAVLAMAQAPGYDANNALSRVPFALQRTARSPTPTSPARRSSS